MRIRYARHHGECDSVQEEIENTVQYVHDVTPEYAKGYVVQSNHDEQLMHWLNSNRPKDDPENALVYHRLWCLLLNDFHARKDGNFSPVLKLWYEQSMGKSNINFLERNDTLVLAGHACSFHGHTGANGSRGSIGQFGKLGVKTVIVHSHSPGIQDYSMQVGVTAALDHEYNSLPSSWFHAHGVLYPDGSRTLIFIVNGNWKS
jgi:hypothetical protein